MNDEFGNVGQKERDTQNRVIRFFRDKLKYQSLGNRHDKDNSNIDRDLLTQFLKDNGYDDEIIIKAMRELEQAAAVGGGRRLYDANKDVYRLLRYGVKIKRGVGQQTETVWLINWEDAAKNNFYVAEEVSLRGPNNVRPDIVIYVNGIALTVLELKRSTESVEKGIRQSFRNQDREFLESFFTTIQFIMAGNDTEGLRYGVIEAKEKYFLKWKEENPDYNPQIDPVSKRYLPEDQQDDVTGFLDVALLRMMEKERFLELVHDFIVFDAGQKKTCRQNQYFGIHAIQDHIAKRQGGILWHSQGSGKSLTMVWLAKWIRENIQDSRVLIVTDRKELDGQIEKVFTGVEESIYKTSSGADLISTLNSSEEWLVCSLVHKFGKAEMNAADVEEYLREIQANITANFTAKGDIYVFIDECHRTQSGKLHRAMKSFLPNALFFGFTGTPLMKKDKQSSLETFGPYIHTYKYDEAVKDKVVLDLAYEARDIDQDLTSQVKVDQWFDAKTKGLTDYAKARLKQKWGTMQKVLSSQSRLEKIVSDILMDFELRDRLADGHGNAILVAGSIFEACKFYDLFSRTELAGKCAIITSYMPSPGDIRTENSGEGETDNIAKYDTYRAMLAEFFEESEDEAVKKADKFEEKVKERFIKEPSRMKLLIVVNKLLTGFDAPSATYLYIDKKMSDHELFQAVCRVNRLDGADKEFGYIIDYKDLFMCLEKSINDYTGGAFDAYNKADVDGMLEDRLTKAAERLRNAREAVKALCENVAPPRDTLAYIRFFSAQDNGDAGALKRNEMKRHTFYKLTGAYIRAFANLANEMEEAGFGEGEIAAIQKEVDHFSIVREQVMLNADEYIDMKRFEPGMRRLIDQYIRAEESEKISAFDDMTLIDLIVERGVDAINELPDGIRKNEEAVAETIENNVRSTIIDEQPVNPKYYERMSQLLDALIKARKEKAIEYKKYLEKIVELTTKVKKPETEQEYPASINSPGKRALYDNLGNDEAIAVNVHQTIMTTKKAEWRGSHFREKELFIAIKKLVVDKGFDPEQIFEIVKNQSEY